MPNSDSEDSDEDAPPTAPKSTLGFKLAPQPLGGSAPLSGLTKDPRVFESPAAAGGWPGAQLHSGAAQQPQQSGHPQDLNTLLSAWAASVGHQQQAGAASVAVPGGGPDINMLIQLEMLKTF